MATDVLESVIFNVPDWLRRLEDLNGQIERRQQDLAKFSSSQPQSSAQSIRNRGSTESLRPKDETAPVTNGVELLTPDLTTTEPIAHPAPKPIISNDRPQTPKRNNQPNGSRPPSPPASNPQTGSVVRQTNELVATAQRRARATVRKRQKTESMMTSEETTKPKYRSRAMVVVYYDSYVQSFFEELVKFVSSQRNLIRKAKMAAKVAQIRRLAELEMPEGDDDEENNHELKAGGGLVAARPLASGLTSGQAGGGERRPQYFGSRPLGGFRNPAALQLISTRSMRTSALNGGLGLFNEKTDIWDELDKGLEYVQSMCEHAAHQFLRDGDCNEEVEKIKRRLAKVKESAIGEQERMASKKETHEAEPLPKEDRIRLIPKSQKIQSIPINEKIQPIPVLEVSQPEPEQEPKQGEIQTVLKLSAIQPESNGGVVPEGEPTKFRTYRPTTVRMGTGGTGASTPSKLSVRKDIEIDEGIDVDMDDFKPVYRSTRRMRGPV
jgi:hypothetical protein